MDSHIVEKNVEDEFILLEGHNIEFKRRNSIARQMNEGEMGVRNEDYDKDGTFNAEKNKQRKA